MVKLNPFYRIQRKKQVRKKLEENALRRAAMKALQFGRELSGKEGIRVNALLRRLTAKGMKYQQPLTKALQLSVHFKRQQRAKTLNQLRGKKKNSPYKLSGIGKK